MSKSKAKSKTILYKLKYPLEWGQETINEIEFRRPKGEYLMDLGKDVKMGQLLALASKCSGQPISIFKEMDGVDALKCCEVIGDFLDSGQKTGEDV